jgi:hypothetical protein
MMSISIEELVQRNAAFAASGVFAGRRFRLKACESSVASIPAWIPATCWG